jgi:AcrR family transcriptional regulator
MLTKSQHTIANILAAAATLFVEKNYAEVTMEQIAAASGVSKGAIYHHFSSKEELYLELIHSDLAEKRRLFQAAVSTSSGCRHRLEALTAAFFGLPPIKRALLKLIRRDINIFVEPVRDRLVRAYQSALPEIVEEVLRDGIKSGEIQPVDARLLSWQFVAMVEVILSDYADRTLVSAEVKLKYILELFFHGALGKTREYDNDGTSLRRMA